MSRENKRMKCADCGKEQEFKFVGEEDCWGTWIDIYQCLECGELY